MSPELLQLLSENKFVALGFGAILALYIAGKAEEEGLLPDALRLDEDDIDLDSQLAMAEAKVELLKRIKSEHLPIESLFAGMADEIKQLKDEIAQLKGVENA